MSSNNTKHFLTTIIILSFYAYNFSYGQEIKNTFQPRMEVEFNYNPIKKLELSFTPEIRFTENFSPNKYLFGFGMEYKLTKWLKPELKYRYEINKRENNPTEYHHQYIVGLIGKTNYNDFSGTVYLRYSNQTDDETFGNHFLRYKAALKYNIPNFRLTPFVAIEAFHLLEGKNTLYKLCYEAGSKYKIKKNQSIKATYKFDYYYLEYKNRHVLGISYKINF